MSDPHKREYQSGDWQNAEQNTDSQSIPTACFLGKRKKEFATLRARAAMAGVTLHDIENDYGKTVFILSRWALTCELANLDAVEAWLVRVTGGGATHASR